MIYFDSGAVMRLVEGKSPLPERLKEIVGDQLIITSVLSVTECLTKPYRFDDQHLGDLYRTAFRSDRIILIAVSESIAEKAAELRARFKLKTPDATHIATAIIEVCETLITFDSDFSRCQGFEGLSIRTLPVT